MPELRVSFGWDGIGGSSVAVAAAIAAIAAWLRLIPLPVLQLPFSCQLKSVVFQGGWKIQKNIVLWRVLLSLSSAHRVLCVLLILFCIDTFSVRFLKLLDFLRAIGFFFWIALRVVEQASQRYRVKRRQRDILSARLCIRRHYCVCLYMCLVVVCVISQCRQAGDV